MLDSHLICLAIGFALGVYTACNAKGDTMKEKPNTAMARYVSQPASRQEKKQAFNPPAHLNDDPFTALGKFFGFGSSHQGPRPAQRVKYGEDKYNADGSGVRRYLEIETDAHG